MTAPNVCPVHKRPETSCTSDIVSLGSLLLLLCYAIKFKRNFFDKEAGTHGSVWTLFSVKTGGEGVTKIGFNMDKKIVSKV